MRSHSTDAELADLATILARAYLRLTQTAQNDAVFKDGEPHKGLDVSAMESPHCVQETP